MATNTGNPFVDALAATGPWSDPLNLGVYFEAGAAGDWTQQEKDLFVSALLSWARVANIGFTITTDKSTAELVERRENSTTWTDGTNPNADHGYPGGQSIGRFNTSQPQWNTNDLIVGGTAYSTMVHELGHAFGLDHPHQDAGGDTLNFPGVNASTDTGDNSLNRRIFTVMSYVRDTDPVQDNTGHVATPMAFDIAAIQQLYGANMGSNSGNTTYELKGDSDIGSFYSCIWDVSGIDEIVYNGASNARIDLRPATLQNEVGGGGFLSRVGNSGFTIAGDFTSRLTNVGSTTGVIIENARGGSGFDQLVGNDADNILAGGLGSDVIEGGAGNDTLFQAGTNVNQSNGDGIDTLKGGGGNDIIYGDVLDVLEGEAGSDSVYLLGAWTNAEIAQKLKDGYVTGGDSFNSFGADIDTLWLSNIQRSPIAILLGTGFTVNILDGGFEDGRGSNGNDVLGGKTLPIFAIELNPKSYSLYGAGGNDTLNGNGAFNYLDGGTGNDIIFANGGDDRLLGGTGNDELHGGSGTDSLNAGDGDDSVYCDYADFTFSINQLAVYVNGGNGYDKIFVEGTQSVVVDLGNCQFEEAYGGDGEDTFDASGTDVAVVMDGKNGADTLIGSIFDDILTDTGIDTGDVFNGNSGRDSVSYQWFQGGVNVDLDYYDTGFGRVIGVDGDIGIDQILNVEIIYGGDGSNFMAGGSLNTANEFVGGSNADQLYGGNGSDTLRGGGGADFLFGESGEDFFYGGRGNDTIDGGSEYDTLTYSDVSTSIMIVMTAAGAGTVTSVETDIDTFARIELIELGSGADFARTAAGSESISLGGGDDVIIGSAGTDLYVGGDGNDTLDYSFSSLGLVFNNDTVTTSLGETDFTYEFENFFGGLVADDIRGNGKANILRGGGGGDHLDGGSDSGDTADYRTSTGTNVNISLLADTASGGEAAGDTLDNIENLFGSLTLRDVLIGDNGANILKGFGGTDSLVGNGGDDYLDGGAGGDTLNAGAGANDWAGYRDNIAADIRVDLTLNTATGGDATGDTLFFVENLEGSLTRRDILIGNLLVNTLVGNGGADIIQGQGGNDIIEGGTGADSLNAGIDTVIYANSSAGVTVNLNVALQTSGGEASGDSLFFFENITGSAFDDTLSGNIFSNRILGGAGSDTLNGALGSDYLTGGSGSDTFRFQDMSFGSDTILDWQDGLDHISIALPLETSFAGLTFTGNGTSQVVVRGFNGTGSAIIVKADVGFTLDSGDFVFV
jgi:Ca2+-binding RTX toxin-like protein